MSRFILVLELELGVIALSVWLSDGRFLAFLAFSPFLLVLLVPFFSAAAVWSPPEIIEALTTAFRPETVPPNPGRSARIHRFLLRSSFLSCVMGFVIGSVIVLSHPESLTVRDITHAVKAAATAFIAVLVAAIVLNQLSEIVVGRRKSAMKPIPADAANTIALECGLTEREREIAVLISGGLSNREIAKKLFLSPETVKNHIYNLYRKTGVKNRGGLAGRLLSGAISQQVRSYHE